MASLLFMSNCKKVLEGNGIIVKGYNINERFYPISVELCKDELLLWTNYYGCMKKDTIKHVVKKYGEHLIIDNTQALFSEPIEEAYNVYSYRKFVGVSEGVVLNKKTSIL